MKNLLKLTSRVLVATTLSLNFVGSVGAQQVVRFNGQQVALAKPTEYSNDKSSVGAPTIAKKQFWILQISEPQAQKTLQFLVSKGIVVGQNLGKSCYIASSPPEFDKTHFLNAGVLGIQTYPKTFRVESGLIQKFNAVDKSSVLVVNMVPHVGISESSIQKNWKRSFGSIEEIWPGKLQKCIVKGTVQEIQQLSNQDWVQWIEESEGEIISYNQETVTNSRASFVSYGLDGLDGKGVKVAVGDGGMVETHADFESNQQNLTPTKIGSFGDHQDHVTGIIGGKGLLQKERKGVAPGVKVYNLQTSAVISTAAGLRQNLGVNLTNNSYGVNLNCGRAGNYSSSSSFIDAQMSNQPDLLHVFAAGNQGYATCGGYVSGFNNISEGYQAAKNVITVGSITKGDLPAWFSSKGPVKDGRVKPEIVSNGNEILSTVPFDSYGEKGGTSMAAPVLTGVLALLTEQYKRIYNNNLPDASLLKALVCNTADDLGNANVDFSNGFGRVNARKGKNAIVNQQFRSGSIVSGGLNQITLVAPSNAKGVKVMLSWTDPAGVPGSTKALINNLDLKVLNGAGISFQPWVLNSEPSKVNLPATRGIDSLNNIEQVSLPVNGNETITVKVNTGNISGPNQKYWICYEWQLPELVLTSPIPNLGLNSGQSFDFQWDISEITPTSMTLEASLDSISGFSQVTNISNSNSKFQTIAITGSNFEKRFYRLKAVGLFGTIYSNVTSLFISNRPVLNLQTCNQSASLTWNQIPGATKYEVLTLDLALGTWNSKAFVSGNSFMFNQLDNNTRYGFSVKPWFGEIAGIQSDGKIGTPSSTGICPWTQDMGLVEIISPKSTRLQTPTHSNQAPATVVVRNFGSNPISQMAVVRYQLNGGQIFQFNYMANLQPGENTNVALPQVAASNLAGLFNLKVWLDFPGDQNIENNLLNHDFKQLANPALTLPWSFNSESLANISIDKNSFSFDGADFMEFSSTNNARLKSILGNNQPYFGTRSLVLDKSKVDGKKGNSDLVFTLNLSQYAQTDKLTLDFDWLPFGTQATGNSIWVRASETQNWIEVVNFSQETYTSNQVKSFIGLNLANFLGGENLTSSFQIKFSFSGQRPSDIPVAGGYAIDNILLAVPSKDVVIHKLLGPTDGCVNTSEIKRVKVRLLNNSDTVLSGINVGYEILGQAHVSGVVPQILANDSLDFEFSDSISSALVGKLIFKIWVRSQNDTYPGNDTVRNLSVFILPKISKFPYYQGFESDNGNWKTYGTKSSWEWGQPGQNMTVIDTAANDSKIWATNLTGNYNPNESSYLESPCFNMSDLGDDFQFSFNSIFQLEEDYDFVKLEMSEDGFIWKTLGMKGEGTNWYSHDSHQWNGLRNNWSVNSIKVNNLNIEEKGSVRFRFAFNSDISLSYEGIGIDDIHIEKSVEILNDSIFEQSVLKSGNAEWIQFGNGTDMVAEVEKRTELGDIELKMKKNEGDLRFFDYTPYLDRNFYIKPEFQPTAPIKVRLFIQDLELKKLQEADPTLVSFQQLGVYKYDGPNEDLSVANNSQVLGSHEFIPPGQVLKVPTAGGYFLEFVVSSFSEFYVSTKTLVGSDDVLPVKITSFQAKKSNDNKKVNLEWKTASEVNCEKFVLSYSCDGKEFAPIGEFQPKGTEYKGFTYSFQHLPEACSSKDLIYKLSQFEIGQSNPALELKAICSNQNPGPSTIKVVNPASDKFRISGLTQETHIEIVDVLGRPMANFISNSFEMEENIQFLPAGNYFVRVKSSSDSQTLRLLKQ